VGAVLIVGASRGFGAALAERLGACGVRVLAMSRSRPRLVTPGVTWFAGDVSNENPLALAPPGALDDVRHLVYAAGDPGAVGPAWQVSAAETARVVDVTFTGFVKVVGATADLLRRGPDSSVLLVGSKAARSTLEYLAVYSAAKAAAERYALCLAGEFSAASVRVNVLGIAAETALAAEHRRQKERLRGRVSSHPPLPDVENNLAPAEFLLSPAARHVSGQVIEACQP
jgi:NAD(P)-dependent dehydrogenase (short-subunit alcohol dehydrogenase family)